MFEITSVEITIDPTFLADAEQANKDVLSQTGEAVRGDLLLSQTMPFRTGALQNESTFVDESKINDDEIAIVSSTPYARRLYYNPQFRFSRLINPNAGGRWLDPYLTDGEKESFANNAFALLWKGAMKKWLT